MHRVRLKLSAASIARAEHLRCLSKSLPHPTQRVRDRIGKALEVVANELQRGGSMETAGFGICGSRRFITSRE